MLILASCETSDEVWMREAKRPIVLTAKSDWNCIILTDAINWGDLKCSIVKALADGRFIVVIDEASPDACPTLCDYIQRHLKMNGWDCEVETEW